MSICRLEHMYIAQRNLQITADPRALELMNEEYIKDMVLAAHSELSEILDEINWKPWKKTQKHIVLKNYKTEVIDLLHFALNLCIAADMEPDEIFDIYIRKNFENAKRQKEDY